MVDQAALYGLLRKVRDLGLPLVSVIQVDPNQADGPRQTDNRGRRTNDDYQRKNETNRMTAESTQENHE